MIQEQNTRQAVNAVHSVLLIEHDRMIASLLKSSLEKAGYIVYQTQQGEQAKLAMMKHQPDLVVMSMNLSDMSTLELCASLRSFFHGPIMVLSDDKSEAEHIAAFEAGADDYLVKPVSPAIIKAHLEALAKRYNAQNQNQSNYKVEVGDIVLYPLAHECKVNGNSIRLSDFEFKLLLLLTSNVGKVLTRDRIYSLLLGREYNGLERTIDVRISKLRDKLSSEGMRETQIETVWGKGYILNERKAA
ncbi:response regulator transcription factor [Thalassotalea agarivorans]|uniref:Two-component system, OmpR family, response regulator RstA n=1 Tax=Thalassotalea agarivorans TaxID=349064 RepID=A0A1I0FW09_THASX|nr:response regulator transcription factor [Thalassotalea agarivorans]SET61658.1 two-component system, OmpR family, response regulator RstA [Thalassotalea agarivorans]